jgi:hypothetical protein
MQLHELSCCTGFPATVLLDFSQRGILPLMPSTPAHEEMTFDGRAMLRMLAEVDFER